MNFDDKLKQLRLKKGLTQEEVAKYTGISRQAYIAYEKNGVKPKDKDTYEKLAEILGCEVEYLRSDESEKGAVSRDSLPMLVTQACIPIIGPLLVMNSIVTDRLRNKKTEIDEIKKIPLENDDEYTKESFEKYSKFHQQLVASATGIIYAQMVRKGWLFRPKRVDEVGLQWFKADIAVNIESSDISTWLFKIISFSEDEVTADVKKSFLLNLLAGLILIPVDRNRKVSFVVDNEEAYKILLEFKMKNSYNGNLSVIYVDKEEVTIKEENYLSLVYGYSEDEMIKIV